MVLAIGTKLHEVAIQRSGAMLSHCQSVLFNIAWNMQSHNILMEVYRVLNSIDSTRHFKCLQHWCITNSSFSSSRRTLW